MNRSHFYRDLLIAGVIALSQGVVQATVLKPTNTDENKIKLNILGKERIYYELTDESLLFEDVGRYFESGDSILIGEQKKLIEDVRGNHIIFQSEDSVHVEQLFESGDSIRIGFHARSIKAPTGKKRRNYGFTIQIDDNPKEKLKYEKSGSKVTSPDRPGWHYTESGIWYVYLPVKKQGYKIKVEPLKGNPVVYLRITINDLIKEGKFSKGLRTVNSQDRWRIETRKDPDSVTDVTTTYWYPLLGNEQQQYEISGPASVRMFTRVQFENGDKEQDQLFESEDLAHVEYYIRIREDGYDLGTYYFNTEKSEKSSVSKTGNTVGKWRSVWLNIPRGKHYYTFTLPNIENNLEKTVYIRLKEWQKEQ